MSRHNETAKAVEVQQNVSRINKIALNYLLYLTQKLHMKMGGMVKVSESELIFVNPPNRHFEVPKKYTLNEMRG